MNLNQALAERGLPFNIGQRLRYNPATEAAIAEGDAIAEGRLEAPVYDSWGAFEASVDDNDGE